MDTVVKDLTPAVAAKDVSLNDKYVCDEGMAYMNGIQALVRLPMSQTRRDALNGRRTAGFISGYRGSPLGNYDSALWQVGIRLFGQYQQQRLGAGRLDADHCASSRARRRRSTASDSGLSPCTQRLSARSCTGRPSISANAWPAAIARA